MFQPWSDAWQEALYGPGGFYRSPGAPAAHFRTACHAAPGVLAKGLVRLGRSAGCSHVVDVGAGGGELLAALARMGTGWRLDGVDVAGRPAGLPDEIGWHDVVPDDLDDTLLVAFELLDVVPCPVAEADADGRLRVVEVDGAGTERLGGPLGAGDLAWCARWWPGPYAEGDRVEVGAPRDRVWASMTSRLRSGVAVAVDYDHLSSARPPSGSLSGFRGGRQVPPVPDGRCDLTAHGALDSVAAAVEGATLLRQRDALARLELRNADAPELMDPGGLGGFGWAVGVRGLPQNGGLSVLG